MQEDAIQMVRRLITYNHPTIDWFEHQRRDLNCQGLSDVMLGYLDTGELELCVEMRKYSNYFILKLKKIKILIFSLLNYDLWLEN